MLVLGWIAVLILILGTIVKFVQMVSDSPDTAEAIGIFIGLLIKTGIIVIFVWFMYH